MELELLIFRTGNFQPGMGKLVRQVLAGWLC